MSDALPLCIQCVYCKKVGVFHVEYHCMNQTLKMNAPNLVTGEPIPCWYRREPYGECGEKGKLFNPRPLLLDQIKTFFVK